MGGRRGTNDGCRLGVVPVGLPDRKKGKSGKAVQIACIGSRRGPAPLITPHIKAEIFFRYLVVSTARPDRMDRPVQLILQGLITLAESAASPLALQPIIRWRLSLGFATSLATSFEEICNGQGI